MNAQPGVDSSGTGASVKAAVCAPPEGGVFSRVRDRPRAPVRNSSLGPPARGARNGGADGRAAIARMSGEKGRRIRRSIRALENAPPAPTPSGGTPPPDEVLRGGVYIQKRRRANAFRNAHVTRYEGRSTARPVERSTPRRVDAISDAQNTAPVTRVPPRVECSRNWRAIGRSSARNSVRTSARKRCVERAHTARNSARTSGRNSGRAAPTRAVDPALETVPAPRPVERFAHRSRTAPANGPCTARNSARV